jgi:SAM-dependent methyltransferase
MTTMLKKAAAPAPMAAPPFNPARAGAFAGKLMGDLAGAMTALVCALGDRLGLFGALAAGPATSAELAGRAGVAERHTREWLAALACAGYIEHDPATGRFTLPLEHAPMLAAEGTPGFMGGGFQQVAALGARLGEVARAFGDGGGVRQEEYGDELLEGMERMSAGWFDHLLATAWLPRVSGLVPRLQKGCTVADVGCGSGRALVALATAFPRSRFTGFDAFGPAVARAEARAREAGVGDRVRFERRDLAAGLPGPFDVVTTFNSAHDFGDLPGAFAAIRRALAPGGVWVVLETPAGERLQDNAGPAGAILYATSVLYNTPVALAAGGDAPGTLGLPESRLRELAAGAGFTRFARVPMQSPFHALFAVEP